MGGGERRLQRLAGHCSGVLQRLEPLQGRRLADGRHPAPLLYVIGWREKLYDSLYDSLVTAYLEGDLDLLRHLDLEGWSVGAARPGQEGD